MQDPARAASSAGQMAQLVELPPELLHLIFRWLDPADLIALPRVSKRIQTFVADNQRLCRDVYLNHLDNPEDAADMDWQQMLRDVVRLRFICEKLDPTKKKPRLPFVYKTVTRLLKKASSAGYTVNYSNTHFASRNASLLKKLFRDDINREAFLQQSFLFERVRNEHFRPVRHFKVPRADHQMSAKLHCLYGRPILQIGRLRSERTYPFACSKVYDLRQYTELTEWGPFMNDNTDRVDWEKMEAILIVLGHNISSSRFVSKIFSDIWDSPFSGSWPSSFSSSPKMEDSLSEDRDLSLEERDPYGVTGLWHQVVCFLDYNDFFAYNFPNGDLIVDDAPRPALSVGEATRLIAMRVHVTAIEPPGPEDGQELPVVHYRGLSRSLDDSWDDNANSGLRGTVRLTKEGEIRWTSFSIFHGQERWRSEGIQIGGLRSARGVIGSWFDRDYDPHGPAGPTAYWKASDSESARGTIREALPTDFFVTYSLADSDSDPEAEMDYTIEEGEGEEEEEDEDDEDDLEFGAVPSELSGLLMDAELDVVDVVDVVPSQGQPGPTG